MSNIKDLEIDSRLNEILSSSEIDNKKVSGAENKNDISPAEMLKKLERGRYFKNERYMHLQKIK